MKEADHLTADFRLVRLHIVILLMAWLAGTVLVLVANAMAPTTPPSPITAQYLTALRGGWGWTAAGYALFFVSDSAIALIGVSLAAWLRPGPGFRGPAMIVLFALSGVLGMLADLRMLGAAQLLRLGSPLLAPETAPAFLDDLNTTCNWLSAASFLPAGIATWLACLAARTAGTGDGWIALTRLGALYQIAAGLISAAAFLTQQPFLTNLALIAAVVGMPVFAAVWLGWMLQEMKSQPQPMDGP
ncbi:MAG: hypothetical protein A3D94_22015 [Alphaproteobacteria bacterium RIFCSPHIGHO2_12_FULL_66_14]|jgi:hypothetical protein|nr:MAG: hypothetical protein A3D94_22015 [Alphaproteobacteria bacterium RIFCSPHIGHO2_12_FULL_66_14]